MLLEYIFFHVFLHDVRVVFWDVFIRVRDTPRNARRRVRPDRGEHLRWLNSSAIKNAMENFVPIENRLFLRFHDRSALLERRSSERFLSNKLVYRAVRSSPGSILHFSVKRGCLRVLSSHKLLLLLLNKRCSDWVLRGLTLTWLVLLVNLYNRGRLAGELGLLNSLVVPGGVLLRYILCKRGKLLFIINSCDQLQRIDILLEWRGRGSVIHLRQRDLLLLLHLLWIVRNVADAVWVTLLLLPHFLLWAGYNVH